VHSFQDMAIGGQGLPDVAVTKELLHDLGMHASTEKVGRRSVAQVMGTDVREASGFEGSVLTVSD